VGVGWGCVGEGGGAECWSTVSGWRGVVGGVGGGKDGRGGRGRWGRVWRGNVVSLMSDDGVGGVWGYGVRIWDCGGFMVGGVARGVVGEGGKFEMRIGGRAWDVLSGQLGRQGGGESWLGGRNGGEGKELWGPGGGWRETGGEARDPVGGADKKEAGGGEVWKWEGSGRGRRDEGEQEERG